MCFYTCIKLIPYFHSHSQVPFDAHAENLVL